MAVPIGIAAQPSGGEWTYFTLNNYDTRYQVNSTINSSNVNALILAWNLTTANSITSTPLVQGGNVYFDDWGGYVYSVNILTGSVNWKENLGAGISSTPILSGGVLYIALGPSGTADVGHSVGILKGPNATAVFALSQYTGNVIWVENLNKTTHMDAIWGSPIIYKNLLYIGVASQGDESEVAWKGSLYAIYTGNGTIAWNTLTGGPDGGDGVWSSVVIDPSLNSLYFGTGNPYSNNTSANSLYGYSVISLNATTGHMNWFDQVCTQGLNACGDADFGSTPNLFTVTIKNSTHNVVGIGNKDGSYYIFDRSSGAQLENFPVGTAETQANPDGGIIGLAAMNGTTNPELFIPSYYHPNSTTSGVVEALNPSTGAVAWRFTTPGTVDGSVTTIPGAVLFGDQDGNIYVLSMASGAELFHYKIPEGIAGGVSDAEGYILAGGLTGSKNTLGLYAFRLPASNSITNTINATNTTVSTTSLTTTIPANGIKTYSETFVENGLAANVPWSVSYPNSTNIRVSLAPNAIIFSSNLIFPTNQFIVKDVISGNVIYVPAPSNGTLAANGVLSISFAPATNTINSTTTIAANTITSSSSSSTLSTTTLNSTTIKTTVPVSTTPPTTTIHSNLTINKTNNGTVVSGVTASGGSFNVAFCGRNLSVAASGISATNTTIVLNYIQYVLSLNRPVQLTTLPNGCYAELTSVLNSTTKPTATLSFFQKVTPFVQPGINSTSTVNHNVSSSTVNGISSIRSGSKNSFSATQIYIGIGALVLIFIAIAAWLATRKSAD
ncbi:MAG: PQQ-binding-like beta-propeller repeat protein [Candidatus Micrarchaeota archaeon]|nr:PQQ-binding-like beta-propeller repeat protein [Candidatus Micrarchaeota archaeon]